MVMRDPRLPQIIYMVRFNINVVKHRGKYYVIGWSPIDFHHGFVTIEQLDDGTYKVGHMVENYPELEHAIDEEFEKLPIKIRDIKEAVRQGLDLERFINFWIGIPSPEEASPTLKKLLVRRRPKGLKVAIRKHLRRPPKTCLCHHVKAVDKVRRSMLRGLK